MTEMEQKYHEATGKKAHLCVTDMETVLAVYIAGYTREYIRWLEARAAQRAEPAPSAAPNRPHTAITRQRILDAIEVLEALAAPQQ